MPSASALWHRPGYDTAGLSDWRATLPRATEIGPLPEQAAADAWARERTLGLIEKFPVDLSPEVVLVLASALATRVSWEEPFRIAPASTLGPDSAWATRLTRVLRSPEYGHRAFIATTKRAGEVIVHVAPAKSDTSRSACAGLSVVSVAAAPDVPAVDVLAAAYELAPTVDRDHPPGRRSLFDLPLGATPLWTIREERVLTYAADGREERYSAVLPCWSAHSTHDLGAPHLGFSAAADALATLLGIVDFSFVARQAAMARYSRYGFEAAAITALAIGMSLPPAGVARIAELRFGHPYAVVAVATDTGRDADGPSVPGPWHGVPVFSAWVREPEDLPEAEAVDATRSNPG